MATSENFYLDNEDLRFVLEECVDWEQILRMRGDIDRVDRCLEDAGQAAAAPRPESKPAEKPQAEKPRLEKSAAQASTPEKPAPKTEPGKSPVLERDSKGIYTLKPPPSG